MAGSDSPSLSTPLALVLGGRTAGRLAKADLVTVSDLLRHYPRKYSQRGMLTDLSHLRVGEAATVWARVESVRTRRLERRSGSRRPQFVTKLVVTDGASRLECAYFNQPWLDKGLAPGTELLLAGTVSEFRGRRQMSSPELATVDGSVGDVESSLEVLEAFAGGIIPVYPQTGGITSAVLQRSVRQALDVLGPIPDPVPADILAARRLIDLDTALREAHRPSSRDALDRALDRLRYDEALALQLVLARRRVTARDWPATPCPRVPDRLLASFDAALPFRLTEGQQRVGEEIAADLAFAHPMTRLLQGEVGSGKTLVALRAMLQVVDASRQAVLLAPTEVLAAQHARTLKELLGPLGRGGELGAPPEAIAVSLLTGSTSSATRRSVLLDIVSGQPSIVVGTHALLSDDVIFTNLGLVVVDEQHRFGVEQREALRGKDAAADPPHVLVMTATPIPRTVAMTVYGDLEVSTLTQLPVGRAGVSTTVVPSAEKPGWLDRAWQRVREEVSAGHQAYVVCAKIGDSDDGATDDDIPGRRPPLAVMEVAEHLRTGPLAGLRLAELHGRLNAADKDAVMGDFAAGTVDVLVATTVIEVGVDVANATMMVVLDAERFGLSQLHQLRGRIGRGADPGVCLLVTEAPAGSPSRRRLDAVAGTTDGFEVAEADLAMRREGDVLGISQSGRQSSLKLLSLTDHADLIATARADALTAVGSDPQMTAYPGLSAMADAIVDADGQDHLQMG